MNESKTALTVLEVGYLLENPYIVSFLTKFN